MNVFFEDANKGTENKQTRECEDEAENEREKENREQMRIHISICSEDRYVEVRERSGKKFGIQRMLGTRND